MAGPQEIRAMGSSFDISGERKSGVYQRSISERQKGLGQKAVYQRSISERQKRLGVYQRSISGLSHFEQLELR